MADMAEDDLVEGMHGLEVAQPEIVAPQDERAQAILNGFRM